MRLITLTNLCLPLTCCAALREIANQILATLELANNERHPFVIYSCHDITILGLLYGIRADFLADNERSGWRIWPEYGSTLTFELVRIDDYPPLGENTHVVRVLLNGRPVITAEARKTEKGRNKPVYTGNGPEHMLLVDDFVATVTKLEDEGGFDYDALLNLK